MTQADQLARAAMQVVDAMPSSIDDDLFQWAIDASEMLRDLSEALAAYRAQADKQGEAVACVLEWGAVSLPVGDSSRITEFEIQKDMASAVAAGRRCGFDWRVYASPSQVAQPLTDEQIDALMPDPDGSAEANQTPCVVNGIPGYDFEVVDAWSRPLVRSIVRAAAEIGKEQSK